MFQKNKKALLIDLDDTLYDYESAHRIALEESLLQLQSRTKIDAVQLRKKYEKSRKKIHQSLLGRASSHSRLLYFQNLLEAFSISPIGLAYDLSEFYWKIFLSSMQLRDGVFEFLKQYEPKNICIISDLTAAIQHRKIIKLGLGNYIHHLVTSEEAGCEKPHPWIFQLALRKLDCKTSDVFMIGDSWHRDIEGAESMGIQTYFFCKTEEDQNLAKASDMVIPFFTFRELINE